MAVRQSRFASLQRKLECQARYERCGQMVKNNTNENSKYTHGSQPRERSVKISFAADRFTTAEIRCSSSLNTFWKNHILFLPYFYTTRVYGIFHIHSMGDSNFIIRMIDLREKRNEEMEQRFLQIKFTEERKTIVKSWLSFLSAGSFLIILRVCSDVYFVITLIVRTAMVCVHACVCDACDALARQIKHERRPREVPSSPSPLHLSFEIKLLSGTFIGI